MKKRLVFGTMLIALSLGLSACGLSSKVSQKSESIEIGTDFNETSVFECSDGVSIKLKDGNVVDTSKVGETTATFVITNGDKTEEKDYSFKIVDTQAPEIKANNVTIYKGADFDPNSYAECVDNSGETVIASVVSNNVDVNVAGEYSVEYEATDSSGNSATQVITVNVISIETAEDVMDLVDEFISKNGYSSFSYNKNSFDAVFITGPDFSSYSMDSNRTLRIYPEIYILEDIFQQKYTVSSIIFRMEFTDRGDQSERYNLYADKLTILSGEESITTVFDGIPTTGDFEKSYYRSKFEYDISGDDIAKLEEMVNSGSLTFDIEPQDVEYDYSTFPAKETLTTIPITYNFDESDIAALKQTLEIYDYMLDVLGQYGE